MKSPPARGRGLKLHIAAELSKVCVAPRAGAWIETKDRQPAPAVVQSPPARGRGLKQPCLCLDLVRLPSPPARGRGLKLAKSDIGDPFMEVAPRAGAWIETFKTPNLSNAFLSPPARGRGLKRIYQRPQRRVA